MTMTTRIILWCGLAAALFILAGGLNLL